MKGNTKDEGEGKKEMVRVELKYCEHCGGLWVRERGTCEVYCEKCQPKVADLPVPKKRSARVQLPVRPRTVVENYGPEILEDEMDLEAAGGVA